MNKILILCIVLTIIVSFILTRLYSNAIVKFENTAPVLIDEPEEEEQPATAETTADSTQLVAANETTGATADEGEEEDDEEEEEEEDEEEDEEFEEDSVVDEGPALPPEFVEPRYIEALVAGNQRATDGIPIKFTMLNDVKLRGNYIGKETAFYATAKINQGAIRLRVSSMYTSKGAVMITMRAVNDQLTEGFSTDGGGDSKMFNDGVAVRFEVKQKQ